MAWMRLEVSYIDHPKFVKLTDGAFRLWHEGKSYCEKHLTDGLISTEAMNGFRYINPRRLEELQTAIPGYLAPLWEVHPVGFKMHDYLDHNDCRDVQLKRIDYSKGEKDRRRKNQQTYRDGRREKATRDLNVTGHESVTNTARVTRKSTPTTVPASEAQEELLEARAGAFIERYPRIYADVRHGAHYHVRAARDFQTFLELVRGWPDDARLDAMFEVFLRLNGKGVLNQPGSPGQFLHHAPECDALLRANGR